jgi:predicted aminopeptidase
MKILGKGTTARAALCVMLIAALNGGCYLLQSAEGQLSLMSKRHSITKVIDQPATPTHVREQLKVVANIRDFASRELHLPDNGSYRSYADVGRSYVVWNVVAAPEFSVTPHEWCYPIVGCVAYRGYFVESRARHFADEQRAKGLDVAVGGVAAYSTLGHFDDPILNTMMSWDDVELASIVFHELTHQLIYIANDASFNEALATVVEEEGVKRWLESQNRQADLQEHLIEQQRYQEVIALLAQTREKLRVVYASGHSREQMQAEKSRAFEELRASFTVLKQRFGGHAPFESWFRETLNNAHLASVATYFVCVPGFQKELEAVHGDLPAFYRRVHELAALNQKVRDEAVCGGADAG